MAATTPEMTIFWPLGVYFAFVIAIIAGMLGMSYFLGQRHYARAKGDPYESGIVATGSARVRLSANFYLFAMFFVIFDLESVFIFAWATAVKPLGWPGYSQICIFVGVLAISLFYLWRQGGLDAKQ